MSANRASGAPGRADGDTAIERLETLLGGLRAAMVDGDVAALEASRAGMQALLSDAAWRRAVAREVGPARLRELLRHVTVDAGLAARGEAYAARALSALTRAPSLYTASGALGTRSGASRAVSA